MTLAIQVSTKLPNGTIYVVGGESWDDFYANAVALFDSDPTVVDELIKQMGAALMPIGAGGAGLTSAGGQPAPAAAGGFYTPGTAPQSNAAARTSAQDVTVSASYQDRTAFMAAIKAAKANATPPWPKFNGDAKNWTLPAGLDLSPFAKWLPPGV